MASNVLKTVALSASLLLAGASLSAYAVEVSVGGVTASALGGGGNVASVSAGGANASVSAFGGGGNVATANVGAGGNAGKVSIGLGGGPLASVDSNGNPLNGGNTTNGAINLGSLLGLGNGGLGNVPVDDGPGAPSAGGPGAIFASLSAGQQAKLRASCKTVLGHPGGYSRDLISICRLLRM